VVDTPAGPLGFRFVPRNDLGVLDHYVTPPGGPETLNPMRVVPNGEGSEVLFTLCAPPGVPDEAWAEDARLVARDLAALKALLEGTEPPGAAPDRTAAGPPRPGPPGPGGGGRAGAAGRESPG
jgi:hypothetical protein